MSTIRFPHASVGISAALLAASLASCKTLEQPFARLESAVVRDRYAGSPQQADVRIVRGDGVVAPSISMRLQKGDSIITSATTRVVVTFAAGYEVTIDTSTAIYIQNPSIFLRIGQAFIRKLRGSTDTLTTHTPQAVLHDASTEFLVTVTPSVTAVRVVEGAVDAQTRDGTYPTVRYSAFEQGEIALGQGPQRMPRLGREEIDARMRWVREVARVTRVVVPQLDSLTEAQARAALDRVGLRVLLVTRRESADHAPGTVVDHTPGAGESVAPGTFVSLVLARAARNEARDTAQSGAECTVPNITGRREAEARRLLEAARLVGRAIERVGEVDEVTSQIERAGTRVRCGSVVRYRWGRVG